MRTLLLASGWTALSIALLSLIRLALPQWPIVIKYDRWEYAVKVVFNAGWSALCFLAIYVWAK